jgi:hypothetical protein
MSQIIATILQLEWIFHASSVSLLSFGPVNNLPNTLDVAGLVVEVLAKVSQEPKGKEDQISPEDNRHAPTYQHRK